MSSRRRQKKGGRTTPKGTRPASLPDGHGEPAEPDLMGEIRGRLRSGEPLDLLAELSSLVAAMDPRSRSPFDRRSDQLSLDQLLVTFVDVDRIETSAVLAGLAELGLDDMQRARARRALISRSHPLPAWLVDLGRTGAYRCVEMVHVLGDGDNVMVGLRLPHSHELTLVIYIDHNMGSLVKDAFVLPEPIADVVGLMKRHAAPDTEWRDLDPADARARITEAVELAAVTFPPLESETWPACRPLVEWAARLLPEGGTGYARPEWDDEARQRLADEFFASPFGARLDDADHRSMLESILWFATDYGPGDPLRWSPVAVEIILADWIPRKILAPEGLLALAPDLLRALIRYAHHQRGIRAGLTDETLAAVDHWEPEYRAAIGTEPDDLWGQEFDRWNEGDFEDYQWGELIRTAGGEEALAALDDTPLPDEPFRWEGVPDDIRERVGEILGLIDDHVEKLGVEHRTACRRLLARAAAGGPNAFRRKARSDIAAATIVWIVGRSNDLFSPSVGAMTAKQLFADFGLAQSSGSQRAATLMKAAGLDTTGGWGPVGGYALGAPELLVSARRRRLMAIRDRIGPGQQPD